VFSLHRLTHTISTHSLSTPAFPPPLRLPLSRPGSRSRTSLHFLREIPDRLSANLFEKLRYFAFGRLLTCTLLIAGSGAQGGLGVEYPLGRSNKASIGNARQLATHDARPAGSNSTSRTFPSKVLRQPIEKTRSSLFKVLASLNSEA
jgi:hypothetical protein